ncbi:MAG: N-acetyl-gamma-glutamyl-phosphate reductase [Methanomassiliicoccales archaeon]
MIEAGIVGGSGYTGGEVARLLCGHPGIDLVSMTSRKHPGVKAGKVHPFLEGFVDLRFDENLGGKDLDLAFVATPYGAAMDLVPDLLDRGIKVVDLSGDYRLKDSGDYRKWYGADHRDLDNLKGAVYGIPELFREEIVKAELVANPGCYPTCAILALAPLLANHLVDDRVIIDAKSGTSGAGAEPSNITHHPVCGASILPYKVGAHRHTPEIKMALDMLSGGDGQVIFTPHLIPIVRGILCTCYAGLTGEMSHEEVYEVYQDFYEGERFIRLNGLPQIPSVSGSNFCEMGFEFAGSRDLVVMAALDNLTKGGAGQAVQNANLMLGLEETSGLNFPGLGV